MFVLLRYRKLTNQYNKQTNNKQRCISQPLLYPLLYSALSAALVLTGKRVKNQRVVQEDVARFSSCSLILTIATKGLHTMLPILSLVLVRLVLNRLLDLNYVLGKLGLVMNIITLCSSCVCMCSGLFLYLTCTFLAKNFCIWDWSFCSDQAILRPISVYTDEALSVKTIIAGLSQVATYVEADGNNLSAEIQGTLIFEDSFGSKIYYAGFANFTSDNDLAVVGGTGKFAGATGDIDFLPRSGGGVLAADLCIL